MPARRPLVVLAAERAAVIHRIALETRREDLIEETKAHAGEMRSLVRQIKAARTLLTVEEDSHHLHEQRSAIAALDGWRA